MKVRSGFVSNSSSSSYLIGIPETIAEEHMFLLDIFKDLLNEYESERGSTCFISNPQETIDEYKSEVKKYEKFVVDIAEIINEVTAFLTDDNLKIINQFLDIRKMSGYVEQSMYGLGAVRDNGGFQSDARDFIDRLESKKREYLKEIEYFENRIQKMSVLEFEKIIQLEMDISWRSRIEERLLRLVDANIVTLIEKETT